MLSGPRTLLLTNLQLSYEFLTIMSCAIKIGILVRLRESSRVLTIAALHGDLVDCDISAVLGTSYRLECDLCTGICISMLIYIYINSYFY